MNTVTIFSATGLNPEEETFISYNHDDNTYEIVVHGKKSAKINLSHIEANALLDFLKLTLELSQR